ncbi:hypothetical protein [uncultured Erythrobacter sp.]|uniref:hypothetical protein n=1 Tax=uncultured Erythrobacter sp. TaxID=263913 RepID=UPI0026073B57|nr:hypothetical protein [uncultured Erythrobacter sp.]
MSDTLTLKGLWSGSFRYDASDDLGGYPFKAKMVARQGALSGLVIEPHLLGTGEVKADIEGVIEGSELRFEKRYRSDLEDYGRVVHYEGHIAPDGRRITGTWRHSENRGIFEMSLTA